MATRLIIKGTMADAIKAAQTHGVPLYRARQHPDYSEVIADTLDASVAGGAWVVSAVRDWFCSPPQDAPYPVGTLLWFGTDCKPLEPCSLVEVDHV